MWENDGPEPHAPFPTLETEMRARKTHTISDEDCRKLSIATDAALHAASEAIGGTDTPEKRTLLCLAIRGAGAAAFEMAFFDADDETREMAMADHNRIAAVVGKDSRKKHLEESPGISGPHGGWVN